MKQPTYHLILSRIFGNYARESYINALNNSAQSRRPKTIHMFNIMYINSINHMFYQIEKQVNMFCNKLQTVCKSLKGQCHEKSFQTETVGV